MNLRLLFFLFTLPFLPGFCSQAFGQADLKTADRYYDQMAFAQATEAYKKLLDKNEPSLDIVQRIAHGYRLMNVSKEAEFWYAQVLAFPNSASINTFFYAEAARRNGNFEKAKQLYLQYGEQVKTDQALAMKLAYACDQAMHWTKNPQPVALTSVPFNSENSDFSPVYYKNGLVFTSDRVKDEKKADKSEVYGWTGKPFLQLYFLKNSKDSVGGKPEPFPEPLNSAYHNDGAVGSGFVDHSSADVGVAALTCDLARLGQVETNAARYQGVGLRRLFVGFGDRSAPSSPPQIGGRMADYIIFQRVELR
jgi:hypothetical protein